MTAQTAPSMDVIETALATAERLVRAMGEGLAAQVKVAGKLDRGLLDEKQPEAFALAQSLAEVTAARAALTYALACQRRYEQDLAAVFVARCLRQLGERLLFQAPAFGFSEAPIAALLEHRDVVGTALSTANLRRIGADLLALDGEWSGTYQLDDDHEEIRRAFARLADEQVAPLAEHIHRDDGIIPESLLHEYVQMGIFGISIPEDYGGSWIDNLTMCLATEELSRASLGAGGSVITRPEICAKALLKGGSEAQKQHWLPKIAQGEAIVSVAVTEPNAGSDVASLRVRAEKVEGGYRIDGEKTWCTFAGRANVFILLARTGTPAQGHRGLTLFLVEKPALIDADNHHSFSYTQPEGGRCEGRAIPTLGYRGMHSFSVSFQNYFVPDANRIGEEGQGFRLQMEGFAGGRIQTAARAIGVMEAALRQAISYTQERKVFGRSLSSFPLPQARLVEMASTLMAGRQLSYQVAALMDQGKGVMEASLVKLLTCRNAEWLTREAMQLHGGMGYSEEYAVSRYWVDARVLSIFEGAEEVLALYVVARQYLYGLIAEEQTT